MSQYKKVFVTGGNGFIGKKLLQHYQQQGVEVCGLDFQPNTELNVIAGDLCNTSEWQSVLAGCDLVIHTAAVVSNVGDYDWTWNINVKATADLLAAANQAGVKRFIHLSSVAALGFDLAESAGEDTPLRPNGNPYVDTKIASEHVVLNQHISGDTEVVIVRPTDVYGPGSRPWVVLPFEMMKKKQFILPEHGKGKFSPVYIDDLIDGIYAAGAVPEAAGKVFQFGSGETLTSLEFFGELQAMLGMTNGIKLMSTPVAKAVCEVVGRTQKLFNIPTEIGANTMDMLARNGGYSIAKAQEILAYEPKVKITEGMERVKEWAQQEGLVTD